MSERTVRVIPIAMEHVQGFHTCVDIVAQEGRYLAATQAPPLESTYQFVENNIKNGIPQFVAVDDQTVVGWCDIIPHGRRSLAHSGNLGMGVHPNYRGQRLGWRLLDTTVTRARELGLQRVELEVLVSNSVAIALYTKYGFTVEGIKKKALQLQGHYHDLMFMALLFFPS